jgi:hypothetical protein
MNIDQKQRAHTILRDLKGARISILLALFVETLPTTQEKLSMVVPYSTRTIRDELKFLEMNGYVERVHYRAWKLPGNNQLPLPGFEYLAPGRAGALPPGNPEPANSAGSGAEPANSAVSAYVRTTTTIPPEAANSAGSDNGDSVVVGSIVEAETANSAASGIPAEIRAALVDIRINGEAVNVNKWSELVNAYQQTCGKPVTAHYLRATAARINQHSKPEFRNAGFFVHCVRQGDEAPENWCPECDGIGEHDSDCATGRREKYLGKHANFANN